MWTLKKILLPIAFLWAMFMETSVYAMDLDDSKKNVPTQRRKKQDLSDSTVTSKTKTRSSENTQLSPSGESEAPFFKYLLGDEIPLKIFFHLCEGQEAIENLHSVAQTCKQGKRLVYDRFLWNPLKQTYFGHLPEEYVQILIKGKKGEGLPLARVLLKQLLTYQGEEITQIKKILSKGYYPPTLPGAPFVGDSYYVLELDDSFKERQLNKLKNSSNRKKPVSEVYFTQEKMLDAINSAIMKECLTFVKPVTKQKLINNVMQDYQGAEINLNGAFTRLPLEGIESLIKACNTIDDVNLILSCNHLRTLPNDLFLIRLTELDLRNNLLAYIPQSISLSKEDLKHLYLGNFKGLGDRCACCDRIGRRTTGNYFENIPPALLTLDKLESLDMRSVGLKKISEKEIHGYLPKLSFIDLRHNNLVIRPDFNLENHTIRVVSLGNPFYSLLTSESDVWLYHKATYVDAPMGRHPFYCSIISALLFFYTLYYFEMITITKADN